MGVIVLTMDDSLLEHATVCAPYLRSKGITATFAMVPGEHEGANAGGTYMRADQARGVQDDSGHECVFHANTIVEHGDATTNQSAALMETSVQQGLARMRRQGLTSGVGLYAQSSGTVHYGDATNGVAISNMLGQYFRARRTAQGGIATSPLETYPPSNPMKLRTAMFNGENFATLQAMISKVRVSAMGAAVVVNHGVSSTTSGLRMSVVDWKAFIDEIAFQRDNGYASGGPATPAGSLKTMTLGQFVGS